MTVAAQGARYLCGLGCQGLLGVLLRTGGVGQGGAPAAKRGRTTLTNPRAGVSTWYGPIGGGVGALCVTWVLDEPCVVGDNNRDVGVPREMNGKRGRVSV